MRKETRTYDVFIAEDDTEFTSEQDCLEYEKRKYKMYTFSQNTESTSILTNDFKVADIVYIDNAHEYKQFCEDACSNGRTVSNEKFVKDLNFDYSWNYTGWYYLCNGQYNPISSSMNFRLYKLMFNLD